MEVILLHKKLNELDIQFFYSIKIIFIYLYPKYSCDDEVQEGE